MPILRGTTEHCPYCHFLYHQGSVSGRHWTDAKQPCPQCSNTVLLSASAVGYSWHDVAFRHSVPRVLPLSVILVFMFCILIRPWNESLLVAVFAGAPLGLFFSLIGSFWVEGSIGARVTSHEPLPRFCNKVVHDISNATVQRMANEKFERMLPSHNRNVIMIATIWTAILGYVAIIAVVAKDFVLTAIIVLVIALSWLWTKRRMI